MKFSRTQVLTALAIFAVTFASGCFSVRDLIPVKVPKGIQSAADLPKSIPLSEYRYEREAYVDGVNREVGKWDADAEDGERFALFLDDLILTNATPETLAALGIPVGGPLALLAVFGLGAITKRPGDHSAKQFREGKERSYNAGMAVGTDTNGAIE